MIKAVLRMQMRMLNVAIPCVFISLNINELELDV